MTRKLIPFRLWLSNSSTPIITARTLIKFSLPFAAALLLAPDTPADDTRERIVQTSIAN